MTGKPSEALPFTFEWRGDIDELRLLLDNDNLRYFARVGPIKSSGVRCHSVELTPQNGGNQEMLQNYFHPKKPPKTRRRRSFYATSKLHKPPLIPKSQRVSHVSIEEQKRRIQAQERINRIGERDRLNIFPPGSNERRCFKIRNGIRCERTLMRGEVRTVTGTMWMWNCLCGDSVDRVVLQNRDISLPNFSN